MGVPCPGCGRTYDVTLFAFGRTLHCACGTRVGLAQRVSVRRERGPRRFAADAMLGKLARWLRILGFDTLYDPEVDDESLVRQALAEGRMLLTRDRALPEDWRISDVYLVRAEGAHAQLREIVRAFRLGQGIRLFTRCSRCNALLRDVPPEVVGSRVPPRVLLLEREFRECPACGRVYWHGSHAARIRRVVEALSADS